MLYMCGHGCAVPDGYSAVSVGVKFALSAQPNLYKLTFIYAPSM